MTMPLFVLALQPGGAMSVARAQEYLDSCKSHGRLYQVVCCEVNPPQEPEDPDMSKRAYARAVAALDIPAHSEAVAAIGLHSHTIVLDRKIQVRKASLALVQRTSPTKPFYARPIGPSARNGSTACR
jgi:hypothetical protein